MVIDVSAVRADTRGAAQVVHLNNAGSSLAPRPVMDAVIGHLRREEEIGGYEAAAEASERREGVYASVARLIGATSGEIALTENGSSGWASVVSALPFVGSRVLLARTEYVNNVLVLRQLARRHGLELVILNDDTHGQVDVEHVQRELDGGDVALVALTHVPMGDGMVAPTAEVGERCRAAGVPFVLDACQSVGQMPVNVDTLRCDVLVGTGRKFLRGPRGTAFVYIRETLLERLEPALRDRHPATRSDRDPVAQARLLESWETSIAGRLGLGRAVDYALELGLEPIRDRVRALAEIMRSLLVSVPSVRLHDRGLIKCGIVTFSVRGRTADQVKDHLAGHRINVSVAAAPPSAAGAVLWPDATTQTMIVRASVHYYNTESEIDRLIHALHWDKPM